MSEPTDEEIYLFLGERVDRWDDFWKSIEPIAPVRVCAPAGTGPISILQTFPGYAACAFEEPAPGEWDGKSPTWHGKCKVCHGYCDQDSPPHYCTACQRKLRKLYRMHKAFWEAKQVETAIQQDVLLTEIVDIVREQVASSQRGVAEELRLRGFEARNERVARMVEEAIKRGYLAQEGKGRGSKLIWRGRQAS
jgi:hypothetical protein